MAAFADTHELIQFARTFLRDRTDSLQRDVQVCIQGATAAFPAILYCFSTIDLLGALLSGQAEAAKGVTDRATAYARRFMHYSEDQCKLLWDIFRHKIVHLAQPHPAKNFKNKKTAWMYHHDDRAYHLKLGPIPPVQQNVASGITIKAEQLFEISIRDFVQDIVDSVHSPGGYLHCLASDADLQDKFAKAIMAIYKP
jgi:hypothetical protein